MNWYTIFYLVSIADGLSTLTSLLAIVFGIATGISIIGYFISTSSVSSHVREGDETKQSKDWREWNVWMKAWRRAFSVAIIVFIVNVFAWALIPTKRDAMLIIAGGAVGNFITSDSSARAIPAEFTTLIRDKMRKEIEEIRSGSIEDELEGKTTEQLKEIIKQQKAQQ